MEILGPAWDFRENSDIKQKRGRCVLCLLWKFVYPNCCTDMENCDM